MQLVGPILSDDSWEALKGLYAGATSLAKMLNADEALNSRL